MITTKFDGLFDRARWTGKVPRPYVELCDSVRLGFPEDEGKLFTLYPKLVGDRRQILELRRTQEGSMKWLSLECRVSVQEIEAANTMSISIVGQDNLDLQFSVQIMGLLGNGSRIALFDKMPLVPILRGRAVNSTEFSLPKWEERSAEEVERCDIILFIDVNFVELQLAGIIVALE